MSIVNKASKNIQSIHSITKKIRAGDLTVDAIIEETQTLISRSDGAIKAWQALNWDQVYKQYEDLMSIPNWRLLPLAAVPIGVKDIYDTADFATTYGSKIYAGQRPKQDAAIVKLMRELGAIVIGKTVTTEFAYWQAGPTVNPYHSAHTPGGSSSGSAAAVATGMVPLALGSQTAASVIRPAAYCGIYGFKPSYGLFPTDGAKQLAASLDTIGFLARSINDLEIMFNALLVSLGLGTGGAVVATKSFKDFVLAPIGGDCLAGVSVECLDGVELLINSARLKSCKLTGPRTFRDFQRLTEDQINMMAAEAVNSFEREASQVYDDLSHHIKSLIADGTNITAKQKARFLESYNNSQIYENRLFGDANILICPSTLSTAPLKLEGTGNPQMSRAFTFLGLPALSIPSSFDSNGLPTGVQVLARRGEDQNLLSFAKKFLT